MSEIGKKIKSLRKSKGLSLKDLSKIMNVSDTALSKIETGKIESIKIDFGKKLCQVLDVSFNELFDIEAPKDENIIDLKELVSSKLKTIKLLEDQIELLSPYRWALKADAAMTQDNVLEMILEFERYIKTNNIGSNREQEMVSSFMKKEALKRLKRQYSLFNEKEFSETYHTMKDELNSMS